ncbi:hypothetical protein X557_04340 [Francisella tularensis subsp. holarctica PHIT-FT049]|nr:hypothetical protein FTH_0810 [Francisella tularensis subsp. holarctica OSU18]AFT92664.1 hypothetical protein FTS_0809 [Francisella tularensis subsp. holarctica FSC200]AHH46281.1 hypothetical protein X557_04340 [Francisella tularensis subsp. holarctica PHIT-FT049]
MIMAYNEKNSSNRTKEASQTRKEHDPEAFSEMGKKGGSTNKK